MAENGELTVATLREKALRFRRLAGEILDGDFRRGLLSLAWDYDAKAESLEVRASASDM
jgi:hypothetical protein